MINDILVSIIIPNYNNSKYLAKCIKSCISQSYKNIEIIVVDDCSSDNSVDIIKEFQKIDDRIQLIENKSNQKVSKTRDIGINASNGDWITTIDSDDFYFSKYKIESEMNVLEKYNFAKNIIGFSKTLRVDPSGKKVLNRMDEAEIKTGHIFPELISRSCPRPRDFIFSKDLYNRVGGYDLNIPIYEDWDLKVRLSSIAEYYFSNNDGTAYRKHSSGLSAVDKSVHIYWMKKVFEKNIKLYHTPNKDLLRKEFLQNIDPPLLKKLKNKLLKMYKTFL